LAFGCEPRSEHAIATFVNLAMISNDISRVIGPIGHDDSNAVPAKRIQAGANGKPEATFVLIRNMAQRGKVTFERDELGRCAVVAVVVDDDDFMCNGGSVESGGKCGNGRA